MTQNHHTVPRLFHLALALVFGSVVLVPLADARVELQPCKNGVTPQQQIELGHKVVEQVYQQMPILPDSSPVTAYVQSLGRKLSSEAPGYKWPYNFHVVNVADINAFALPGGSIFVNLGTVQAAKDEAQLAAVMAHEISHVVLQHSVCNAEKQQRVGLIAGIGQIASGLLLGNGVAGALARNAIGLGAGLGLLKMSRGDEKEADLMGVGILYDAGYDPHAMPQFFQRIEEKYGKGGAQFLSDHPNPGNRVEYVDQEISGFIPKKYVEDSPAFERIHQIVAKMHAYTAKEVASGVWKGQSPNQTVSTGVNQIRGSASSGQIDSGASGTWNTFRGAGFTISVPSNWRAVGNQNAAMLAPQGGINDSNLVFGVLTDTYRGGSSFRALVSELQQQNPGMQPGSIKSIQLAGLNAESVESVTASANEGRGEHDWIVGVSVSGAVRYFVCVAPEPDFNAQRPTFERILNSIRIVR